MSGRIHRQAFEPNERLSLPHKLSRALLAAECALIILPVCIVAVPLIVLLVWAGVPFALVSFGTADPVLIIVMLLAVASGAIMTLGLGVTVAMSLGYVVEGRSRLRRWPRDHWRLLWVAPFLAAAWLVSLNVGMWIVGDVRWYSLALMFSPGILLTLPAFHVQLAKRMAEARGWL